jgi:hypothetical protein
MLAVVGGLTWAFRATHVLKVYLEMHGAEKRVGLKTIDILDPSERCSW